MTHDLSSLTQTAIAASVIRPVTFVELDYLSGFARANSSDRDIDFDPGTGTVTFLGVGALGSVAAIGETRELQASSISVTLSGIPGANISQAFDKSQGRPAKIWQGFLNESFGLVDTPILMFVGLIDNTNIILGNEGTVTVNINNRFIEWSRDKIRRYTNEDHQARFSGDLFFEFVIQAVEKEIVWGPGGPEPTENAASSSNLTSRQLESGQLTGNVIQTGPSQGAPERKIGEGGAK